MISYDVDSQDNSIKAGASLLVFVLVVVGCVGYGLYEIVSALLG